METYPNITIYSDPPVALLRFYSIYGTIALVINILGAIFIWYNHRIVNFYKYFLFHMQIISLFADAQLSLLMQPVLLCPLPALYSNGPLWNWFGISSHLQMGIFLGFVYLQIASIVSAIVAKHQVIVSIGTIEIHPFLFWIFIISYHFISVLIFLFFYLSELTQLQIENLVNTKFPNALNYFTLPNTTIYDMSLNSWFFYVMICIIIVMIISVMISAYFSMDLVRVLHRKRSLLSAKNFKSHKVAVTSLMAQASLPMLIIIVPMLIINYFFVRVTPNTQELSNVLMAIYSVHTSLSTIVMIISTPQYRKSMAKRIKVYFPFRRSSSVHAFPNPANNSNSTSSKVKSNPPVMSTKTTQNQRKSSTMFAKF